MKIKKSATTVITILVFIVLLFNACKESTIEEYAHDNENTPTQRPTPEPTPEPTPVPLPDYIKCNEAEQTITISHKFGDITFEGATNATAHEDDWISFDVDSEAGEIWIKDLEAFVVDHKNKMVRKGSVLLDYPIFSNSEIEIAYFITNGDRAAMAIAENDLYMIYADGSGTGKNIGPKPKIYEDEYVAIDKYGNKINPIPWLDESRLIYSDELKEYVAQEKERYTDKALRTKKKAIQIYISSLTQNMKGFYFDDYYEVQFYEKEDFKLYWEDPKGWSNYSRFLDNCSKIYHTPLSIPIEFEYSLDPAWQGLGYSYALKVSSETNPFVYIEMLNEQIISWSVFASDIDQDSFDNAIETVTNTDTPGVVALAFRVYESNTGINGNDMHYDEIIVHLDDIKYDHLVGEEYLHSFSQRQDGTVLDKGYWRYIIESEELTEQYFWTDTNAFNTTFGDLLEMIKE